MHKSFIAKILDKTPLSVNEIATAIILFILSFSFLFISRYTRIYNSSAISTDTTTVVYIHHTINLRQLNQVMDRAGICHDSTQMYWVAKMLGWRRFQTGRYVINGYYSYSKFLKKLAYGIQDPLRVTILPGQLEKNFIREVSQHFMFDGQQLNQAMHDTVLLDSLGVPEKDIFGYMLPNTYRFYWTSTPAQFLSKMVNEFRLAVADKYKKRFKKLHKSVSQIVTIASIVEWEAEDPKERPLISGLYWNRLKKGWYLQADPTIDFILGQRKRLLYKDYHIKSPYNTYIHKGLPPGPITNPSMGSIKAALFPDHTDYMYMVARPDDSGDHDFSVTYAQHLRASTKWREWLRKQYRIKREREREAKLSDTSSVQ